VRLSAPKADSCRIFADNLIRFFFSLKLLLLLWLRLNFYLEQDCCVPKKPGKIGEFSFPGKVMDKSGDKPFCLEKTYSFFRQKC